MTSPPGAGRAAVSSNRRACSWYRLRISLRSAASIEPPIDRPHGGLYPDRGASTNSAAGLRAPGQLVLHGREVDPAGREQHVQVVDQVGGLRDETLVALSQGRGDD